MIGLFHDSVVHIWPSQGPFKPTYQQWGLTTVCVFIIVVVDWCIVLLYFFDSSSVMDP